MDKKKFYIKESLKLFLKFGIKSVTIGQITQELNVSSKTLYNIFTDKTGLVHECFQLYKANTDKAYSEMLEESENVADALLRFYDRLIQSTTFINPNFFIDISKYFPEIWDSETAFGIEQTRELLHRGIEEGIFFPTIDQKLCSETCTLLLRFMFERNPFPGRSQLLFTNVLWPYLRGISTPEGRSQFRKFREQRKMADQSSL